MSIGDRAPRKAKHDSRNFLRHNTKVRRADHWQRRLRLETLEERQLLSVTIPAIGNQTVQAGAPLHLPLASSGTTNPVNYTVSVDNGNVTAFVPTGNTFLKMHVDDDGDNIHGDMVFELFNDLAPQTVAEITGLVNNHFYDGLTFHRVIDTFMIQGGDPTGTGAGGPGFQFDDEFNANLQFTGPGILAMANSGHDTNGSQFFVTDAPARWLDFGYSIFGFLVKGDDVRNAINSVPTDVNDRPIHTVTITSAAIVADTLDGVLRLSAPANATAGSSLVTVTATDAVTHETSSQQFMVTVAGDTTNDPPFLGAIGPVQTTVNTPVTFSIPATDVEGDAIYYDAVVSPANGNLTIAVNHATGAVTLTPSASLAAGVYSVKVGVAASSSGSFDTQFVPVYVSPAAPASVQLLPVSDTGMSNSDRLTNLNNTSGKTLQFQVNGVTSGDVVRLYADGDTLIGEGTAAGTSIVITTNGTVILTDGAHAITAKQVLPNRAVDVGNLHGTTDLASSASSALGITVAASLQFNFTPITTATPYAQYSCPATAVSATAVAYQLIEPPPGMFIATSTGLITWTPTAAQLATPQTVTVKAIDMAGNTAQTSYSIALNTAPVVTRADESSVQGPIVGFTTTTSPLMLPLSSIINHGAGTTTIVDSDAGAIVGGIALTSAPVVGTATGNPTGLWEYSTDGGTTFHDVSWLDLQNVEHPIDESHCLLLPKDTIFRYTPSGTAAGTAFLAYRAWDMSSGAVGDLVNLSQVSVVTGGSTAFSTGADNVQIVVNDAPVLTAAGPSLGAVEDSPVVITLNAAFFKTIINGGAGTTTTTITDNNKSPYAGGIAITGLTGDGTWEYAAPGSLTFVALDSVGLSHAILLSAPASPVGVAAQLRYTPNASSGPASFTFVAWDKSTGKIGDFADLSKVGATGGATAFSTASDTATLAGTFSNSAPVLTAANPSLGATNEHTPVVIPLTSFINNGTGTTAVTDADFGAVVGGIAIIGCAGNGAWEYTLEGASYHTITAVSDSSALLLPRDASLRYTPDGQNGENAAITYRAWDATGGASGGRVDLSQPALVGGHTAFSTATDTATVHVTQSNSPPSDIELSNSTVPENQPAGTTVGTLTATDPDSGDVFTFSLASGTGDADNAWFTIAGNTLSTSATFDFETKSVYSIRVRATDQGGASYEKALSIWVSDEPEIFGAPVGSWTDAGLTLKLGDDGRLHLYQTGTTIDVVPPHNPAFVTGVSLTGRDGADDVLTVDLTAGDPIPAGGVWFNGGMHSSGDKIVVKGSDDYDNVTLTATQVNIAGSSPINYSQVEFFGFDLGEGYDHLAVDHATLRINDDNAVSSGTDVTIIGGTLDLGGKSDTVGDVKLISGSITGGTLHAASYNLLSGYVTAELAGPGSITKSSSGQVVIASVQTPSLTVSDGTLTVDSIVCDTLTIGKANNGDTAPPQGYWITAGDGWLNGAEAAASGFTFANAEVGTHYAFTVTSSGGAGAVSGSGMIASANQHIGGIDVSSLPDGVLTFSVTLTDAAGNVGAAATAATILDKIAPAGYSISVDDNLISASEATNVSFTFAGAEVGATYSYSIVSDGGPELKAGSGTITSADQRITGIDVSLLSHGVLTFYAALTDAAGNVGAVVTATANLDKTPPAGYSIVAGDNMINAYNATSTSIAFTGAEIGATYAVIATSSGGPGAVTVSGTITSANQQVTGIDVSSLPDGDLTFSVTLTDAAGNLGATATTTAILDRTAPTGYSVTADDSLINEVEAANVSFTFAGAEVGATYSYVISDSDSGTITDTGTITSANQKISTPYASFLADGTLTLSVTLTDAAGNVGAAATATAILDRTAPAGYSIAANDSIIGAIKAFDTGFTMAGAEIGATYVYSVASSGGSGIVTGTGTVTSANQQVSGVDVSSLANGTLTFHMRLTDAAGNAGPSVTATATLNKSLAATRPNAAAVAGYVVSPPSTVAPAESVHRAALQSIMGDDLRDAAIERLDRGLIVGKQVHKQDRLARQAIDEFHASLAGVD